MFGKDGRVRGGDIHSMAGQCLPAREGGKGIQFRCGIVFSGEKGGAVIIEAEPEGIRFLDLLDPLQGKIVLILQMREYGCQPARKGGVGAGFQAALRDKKADTGHGDENQAGDGCRKSGHLGMKSVKHGDAPFWSAG